MILANSVEIENRVARPLRSPITVVEFWAAFWQQMLPTVPVLPVFITHKY
jgi:hypothetical protein